MRDDGLACLRHGPGERSRRRPARQPALPLLRRRHHDQPASGSSTTSASATCSCRWSRSRRRATYVTRPHRASSSSTSKPTCPSSGSARSIRQARGVPVDLRGLRHVRRTAEFDPDESSPACSDRSASRAGSTPCSKQLLGSRDLGATAPTPGSISRCFALQLDRRRDSTRIRHRQGRQLARADAVPRQYRTRRGHPAGGRRLAQRRCFTYISEGIDCLLKIICQPQWGWHRVTFTTSATRPTISRSASSRS